ncbi:MAG TPA: hypothetical protein VIV06_10845 [Candidatus Limnocylindrales bacterium]
MANRLQDKYRNNILGDNTYTNVQLDADTIAAMFIDAADDTLLVSDGDLSLLAAGARVPAAASCPALGTKTIGTIAVGVFGAANTVFSGLTGDQVEHMIVFKNTGTDNTSIICAFWDTFTSGMPLTPNGGDVTVQWNGSGIFSV